MLQDKLYNSIKYQFQLQSNEQKFIEYSNLFKKNGINNWDENLIQYEESDILKLGVQQNDLPIFLSELKKRRNEAFDYSIHSENSQIYSTATGPLKNSVKQLYTEDKIERDLNKIYEAYNEVNNEFFNQFPDLSKIIFLNLISSEKMLIVGGLSSNAERIINCFMKYLDIQKNELFSHLITHTTKVEELLIGENSSNQNQMTMSPTNQMSRSGLNISKYFILHQIFLSNSPLINAIISRFQDPNTKTVFAISEQEPDLRAFDLIVDEFAICYFDEYEFKQKNDNFEEFVDALWSQQKKPGFNYSPEKVNSKKNIQAKDQFKVPISFQGQLKLDPEFLDALTDEAFQKVEDSGGLLKIYLKELREMLIKEKLFISQKRWLKIFQLLKLIAYTRGCGDKRKICLSDCFIIPYFIARNKQEFNIVEQKNLDLIENLTRVYGSYRMYTIVDQHFWLLKHQKNQIKEIRKRHLTIPSFFNGCISHPEYMQLGSENQELNIPQIYYCCSGADKKILSDEFIQLDINRAYELKIDIKTNDQMVLYVGLVCFDHNKEFIHSTQVCRNEGSQVILIGDDEEKKILKIDQDSQQSYSQWNQYNSAPKENQKNFAYLRSIGFYEDGDLHKLVPFDRVLQDSKNPYSSSDQNGIYTTVKNNEIQLTNIGYEKYLELKMKGQLVFGKTKIMNHFEGGTYTFAECFDEYVKKWITKSYWFKGETRGSESNKFRKGTKFVKIVLLSNYNSGFPDFKIHNKDASVFWRNINFNYLK